MGFVFCNTNNYHTLREIATEFSERFSDGLLKIKSIFEGDAAIGALHITNSSATKPLVLAFIDVGIVCDDLAHHIDVHALLEKN